MVQEKIVSYEKALMQSVAAKDADAIAMIKNGVANEVVVKALTEFSVNTGDTLVDDWNAFFGELFCDSRMGLTPASRRALPPLARQRVRTRAAVQAPSASKNQGMTPRGMLELQPMRVRSTTYQLLVTAATLVMSALVSSW